MNDKERLQCKIENGNLIISIGIDTLKYLAESSESADVLRYHKHFNPEGVWTKISNKKEFAKDVLHELLLEREDGTTIVYELLDDAIAMAIENGSTGVKFK